MFRDDVIPSENFRDVLRCSEMFNISRGVLEQLEIVRDDVIPSQNFRDIRRHSEMF